MLVQRGKKVWGQSFVEFALILPVLIVTVLIIVELGRLFFTWFVVEQSARAGVRFAVTLEYDPAFCPSGAINGECIDATEEKTARLRSIKDTVRDAASILNYDENVHWMEEHYFKTTVCVSPRTEGDPQRYLPPDPDLPFDPADCIYGDDPGGPGDFVLVTVDYNHPLVVPVFKSIWPQIHLHARREARAETFRSNIPVFMATAPASYGNGPTSTSTPNHTATITLTPLTEFPTATESGTGTPTPDCSLLYVESAYRDDNEVHFIVRNENQDFPYLIRSVFFWPANDSDELFHFTRMYFPYYNFHEYVFLNRSIFTSPVDSGPVNLYWPEDARPSTDWAARFIVNDNQPVFGHFSTSLTFEYPFWGTCQVSGSVDFPRVTKNPTGTPTPGASPTTTSSPTPGGPTPTRRVTRTLYPSSTPTPDSGSTATATNTQSSTRTAEPTLTSTAAEGPGD
ncbi:MAG: pilus assembly protein [Anaerolineales bacterium]|nr:pilus assembly protein [Anaerolineales bacterium]